MTSYISKLGVSLVAFALVVAPTLVLAQVNVTISNPTAGQNVTVNQTVNFIGSATGGDTANYKYRWTWSDGAAAQEGAQVSRTFTSTGSVTATLAVDDFNTVGTKSVTINVVNGTSQPDLVISNIRVESKTANSAVIKWTTNRAATSRVIYDTVSRANTDGSTVGTKPNYNYAFSQPTSVNSSSPKTTEHSVTLTGLSANTKYFFRVLSAE